MNDLQILIARLGWPSTSARWWTMQELAARLGDQTTRRGTESALLQLLHSRKLEAEVVEILCVFWIAAKGHGYSPAVELSKNIPKHSLLSNLLIEDLGLSACSCDTYLEELPEDFKIPDDFDSVQGVDLPKIFKATLHKLEIYSGLPFVRRMAFEWTANRTAYPEAPYQGDLSHFSQSLGDGFIRSLSSRTSLRVISAYLRTLAIAEQRWGMPSDLAGEKSLLALPVHPTLAFLRPKRPLWFPTSADFDGDSKQVEAAFRALIARVEAAHPGDELISFSSPITISAERCVEVSLVRWAQDPGSKVVDGHLGAHLSSFWAQRGVLTSSAPHPLSTTTIVSPPKLEELVDKDSQAWPLAGTLDFDRIGYLQHDLYPSRLFLPAISGLQEVTPHNEHLEIKVKDQVVANLLYWNAGWGSVRPKPYGGNCGTALISRGKTYRKDLGFQVRSLRAFYLWQIRTLHRSVTFEEFRETLATGTVFV